MIGHCRVGTIATFDPEHGVGAVVSGGYEYRLYKRNLPAEIDVRDLVGRRVVFKNCRGR
jgi:hypothetical protein